MYMHIYISKYKYIKICIQTYIHTHTHTFVYFTSSVWQTKFFTDSSKLRKSISREDSSEE